MDSVVKGGSIVEQGSHQQLMANKNGVYEALAKLQQLTAPPHIPDIEIAEADKTKLDAVDTASSLSTQSSLEKQVGFRLVYDVPLDYFHKPTKLI
jgi:ribosomal protein S3